MKAILIDFIDFSYYSKRFRYTEKRLKKMFLGRYGIGQQLLAMTLVNLEKSFIEKIENNSCMKKLTDIEYLKDDTIIKYFNFRKEQLNWKTEEKILMLNCLYNVPVCYVTNFNMFLCWKDNLENFKNLFPLDCNNCNLFDCCKHTREFRM